MPFLVCSGGHRVTSARWSVNSEAPKSTKKKIISRPLCHTSQSGRTAKSLVQKSKLSGILRTPDFIRLSEGSVWEAAQFASLNRLTNLIAIVDVHGLVQS